MSSYTDYVVNARAICLWDTFGQRKTIKLDTVTSVQLTSVPERYTSNGVEVIGRTGHTLHIVYGSVGCEIKFYGDDAMEKITDLDETLSNWLMYGDSPEGDSPSEGYDVGELASFVRHVADDFTTDGAPGTLVTLIRDARNIMGQA
jgi:hypothetical protein